MPTIPAVPQGRQPAAAGSQPGCRPGVFTETPSTTGCCGAASMPPAWACPTATPRSWCRPNAPWPQVDLLVASAELAAERVVAAGGALLAKPRAIPVGRWWSPTRSGTAWCWTCPRAATRRALRRRFVPLGGSGRIPRYDNSCGRSRAGRAVGGRRALAAGSASAPVRWPAPHYPRSQLLRRDRVYGSYLHLLAAAARPGAWLWFAGDLLASPHRVGQGRGVRRAPPQGLGPVRCRGSAGLVAGERGHHERARQARGIT
jgi:hypothetical protein